MTRPALAASRTVTVLNFLAEHSPDEFTLSDIADRVDINLASCHALLAVLTDAGYVSRNPRLKTYSLGSVLVALGNAAVRRHPAIEHAHEQARQLSEDLRLAVRSLLLPVRTSPFSSGWRTPAPGHRGAGRSTYRHDPTGRCGVRRLA